MKCFMPADGGHFGSLYIPQDPRYSRDFGRNGSIRRQYPELTCKMMELESHRVLRDGEIYRDAVEKDTQKPSPVYFVT